MSASSSDPEPTLRGPEAGRRVFGRYVLERLLGRGGMGVVWAARDETLGEHVALKFLPDAVRWDPAAFDDLKAETRRARQLTHPNIVRIHDFVEDASFAAISMELVAGQTLTQLRLEKENKILEPADIAPWLPQLCAALDYAHTQARVVHRDLKPSNLMLTCHGTLKVADFGVARSLVDSITRVSMMSAGTLVYMSPQQAMGEEPSPADDIYALGATLYELLTSKPPFHTGDVRMQLFQRKPDSIALRRRTLGLVSSAAIALGWEKTIAACLAKDATARPATVAEVGSVLGRSSPSHVGRERERGPRPPMRRLAWLLATLFATAQLAVWFLWPAPDYAAAIRAYPRASRAAPSTRLVSRISFDDDTRDEGGQFENLRPNRLLPTFDRHGRADRAMYFNGSEAVEADAGPALRGSLHTPFSVACWVRLDARPSDGCRVISLDPEEVGRVGWYFDVATDLRPSFCLDNRQVENPRRRPLEADRVLAQGRWHHLAGVNDGRDLRLFVDGELAAQAAIVDPDVPAGQRPKIRLGGGVAYERNWLVGALDEVRIYRGALTAVEVRALARDTPARFVLAKGLFGEGDDVAPVLRAEFGPAARIADWYELKAAAGCDVSALADQLQLATGNMSFFVTHGGARDFDGRRYYALIRFDGQKPDYYLAHDELGGQVICLGSWYGVQQGVLARIPLPAPAVERVDFTAPVSEPWRLVAPPVIETGRLIARGTEVAVARSRPTSADTISITWRGWIAADGHAMGTRVELTDAAGKTWVAACESIGQGTPSLRVSIGKKGRPERVIEMRPTFGELQFTLVARAGVWRFRGTTASSGARVFDDRFELPNWKPAEIAEARWLATAESGASTWLADIEWREERSQ